MTCTPDPAYVTPYACPGYRLPTEAEWEYAARAGTTTATYNGTGDNMHLACEQPNPVLDTIAWFCGNSVGSTKIVATRVANAWGLADMLGNVKEWTGDWRAAYPAGPLTDPWGSATGTARVIRGGGIFSNANDVRAAARTQIEPYSSASDLGFRPVRALH